MLGIGTEAAVFLYAGLTGMTAVYAYCVLVCIRKVIPHSSLAVGAEDFIFWILLSIYLFQQIYAAAYGSIRWFFVLGAVCGAVFGSFVAGGAKKLYLKFTKKLEKFRKNR